jgi:hypothetical protein
MKKETLWQLSWPTSSRLVSAEWLPVKEYLPEKGQGRVFLMLDTRVFIGVCSASKW